jgi:hypothetical protein
VLEPQDRAEHLKGESLITVCRCPETPLADGETEASSSGDILDMVHLHQSPDSSAEGGLHTQALDPEGSFQMASPPSVSCLCFPGGLQLGTDDRIVLCNLCCAPGLPDPDLSLGQTACADLSTQ